MGRHQGAVLLGSISVVFIMNLIVKVLRRLVTPYYNCATRSSWSVSVPTLAPLTLRDEMSFIIIIILSLVVVGFGDIERSHHDTTSVRASEETESGCYYEGSWFTAGAAVRTREACLSCVCARGALSCRRRSCAASSEPPAHCSVVHRRGECCPELHCPNRTTYLDDAASSRSEDSYIDVPSSIGHACVEGGTVYAAGSAMSSSLACEQCFCLGGRRRCVRPRCLPPPPGCSARPASRACCPQRYYCLHGDTKPPIETDSHDCLTPTGTWVQEGGRVKESESSDCVQCFCLHGSIRCQHLSCAPMLHGCKPLVQPGQCCAHQYMCDHNRNGTKLKNLSQVRQNVLLPVKEEFRSFHTSKSTKRETTLRAMESVSEKSTAAVTVTKEEPIKSTVKVKRKIEENLSNDTVAERVDTTKVMELETTQNNNDITSTITPEPTTEMTEELMTEQPEGSVRVIINGTINCTAELSSTSLFLNVTNTNDTIWIQDDVQPRVPLIDQIENLDHTFPPNDIITEGNHNANFDEDETYTVNVTSSLHTNNTRSTPATLSSTALPKTILPALIGAVNMSKTKKDEYDYDYTEPTLPPSLPNLKIIPFVAADAVVDSDMSPKEMPNYPSLTRDDKFPVYYPTKDSKETVYETHREDVYNLTHYSMFTPGKNEPQYPGIVQDEDDVNIAYPRLTDDVGSDVHEYTVSASFGNPGKINSGIVSEPSLTSKFDMKSPDVNLFSPPVETEGGFVPKDPGLIDDYYTPYQSTSSGIIPHLTTSMPLNTKDECLSDDGRRVSEGESINVDCSICSCMWGELHCSPRPCHTPPGCKRQMIEKNTADSCCGKLICDQVDKIPEVSNTSTSGFQESFNETFSSMFDDKNNLNVTQKENPTFDDALHSDNKTIHNVIRNNTLIDILLDNTTKSSVISGIPLNATTTEKVNMLLPSSSQASDYEEEDDDEGFSLGSVLKLLLSETYDTTTSASKKKPTTTTTHVPKVVKTTAATTTTRKQSNIPPFVPLTQHFPYIPPKQSPHRFNTVDRIDHLVLGEASAIRTTTTQAPVTYKPVTYTTTKKIFTTKTTQRPVVTKSVEINSKEGFVSQSVEKRPTSNLFSGFGLGLPKLAGCNIYGRMYRVGRIIAELSSPCQECKCTEVGVQCRSLGC
ncbi:unnamed protein product [Danaus chrysippus]|uniref:(African queen) hypothetical protein n=1 Tax=Danaus chrysippus TaxID=151541 RepID=A0A8J2W8D5_9NEOP|nr:unnamed protein product [Danaus chrysippus]